MSKTMNYSIPFSEENYTTFSEVNAISRNGRECEQKCLHGCEKRLRMK